MANTRTVLVEHSDGSVERMNIDKYAKGVLPYEMATGWPLEALKAQAVAAKSYALAAGRVYTDTRSQVYGPLRCRDTDAAVKAVRGIYLAHQGQIIMPFYFAHCPGRTRSPYEAGWNRVANRPYLRGVPCECGRRSYYGHGIGMCQRGAQAMAQRGIAYDKILKHYYRGVQLLRLDEPRDGLPTTPANARTHTVKRGDTLAAIGAKFGVRWQAIHQANANLISNPNLIEPGWKLVIPGPPKEEGDSGLYVVQPGDTLGALAGEWGCSVNAIANLNSIPNPDLIRVGQRLRKP